MQVVRTRAELAAARAALPGRVGLVPTMGALHDGHASLLDAAGQHTDQVVASIFVNPLQFGPGEDFDRYPRALESDLTVCEKHGVAVVWTPGVTDMYRNGKARVTVDAGQLGNELEGASRPGHFAGMLTVVAKLLGLVQPHSAFFGEKDYQQLILIQRMTADLDIAADRHDPQLAGVHIVGEPIVREPDGLAMSSRNAFLNDVQRGVATTLIESLRVGRDAAADGADAVLGAARRILAAESRLATDYVALRGPDLGPVPEHGPARLLVAARVGSTRLIDNLAVTL